MEQLFVEEAVILSIAELDDETRKHVLHYIPIEDLTLRILLTPLNQIPSRKIVTWVTDEFEVPTSFYCQIEHVLAFNLWLTYTQQNIISHTSVQKFSGRSIKQGAGNVLMALRNIQLYIAKTTRQEIKLIPLAKIWDGEDATLEDFFGVQPKFDGVRMIVTWDVDGKISYTSRRGKELNPGLDIDTTLQTRGVLSNINNSDWILDGELCGLKMGGKEFLPFQKTSSLVRSSTEDKTPLIYILFDIYNFTQPSPLPVRWHLLHHFFRGSKKIYVSPKIIVSKENFLRQLKTAERHLSIVYEGLMLKPIFNVKSGLKSGQLKHKFYQEIEVIVLNITQGSRGKLLFHVRPTLNVHGLESTVTGKFTQHAEEIILQNRDKLLNAIGRIRYCQTTAIGQFRSAIFYSTFIDDFLSNN